jgi:hypothetical protein
MNLIAVPPGKRDDLRVDTDMSICVEAVPHGVVLPSLLDR